MLALLIEPHVHPPSYYSPPHLHRLLSRTEDDAIAYVGEGAAFFKTQYSDSIFPLTEELKAKGLGEDGWAAICKSLSVGKGWTGIGGGFSKAIADANEEYFSKIGCVAAYAEYGPGQKAMVVLTQEAADAGRVAY